MTDIASELRASLDALGSTPDEIADTLRNKGIRGNRRGFAPGCKSLGRCVLEAYLDEQFPAVPSRVGAWTVQDVQTMRTVQTSTAVAHFVARFDAGDYPDLVS